LYIWLISSIDVAWHFSTQKTEDVCSEDLWNEGMSAQGNVGQTQEGMAEQRNIGQSGPQVRNNMEHLKQGKSFVCGMFMCV
jgi:hypothetical protein